MEDPDMADDRLRRDPDELDFDDDEFMEDGGGIAELPADAEDEDC
jgi:hypothetical protein